MFTQYTNLQSLHRVHTGEKPFQCQFCHKCFGRSSSLRHHLRIHTGEKPFQCELCHKRFGHSGHLKRHLMLHTGEKPYVCDFCPRRFTQYANLQSHHRAHTGERPFKCEFCPKRFTQYAARQSHQSVHTGEKPFQCEFCHKCFGQSRTLRCHIRMHTGEKPFLCEFCHKRFSRYDNLQSHHRVHTGEKPFQCKLCHKHFGHKSSLHNHLKSKSHAWNVQRSVSDDSCKPEDTAVPDIAASTEAGTDEDETMLPTTMTEIAKGIKASELNETPKLSVAEYQCEHCSKVCKSAADLTNHQRSHLAHTCQFCGKVFCNTDTLQDHLSEIHQDQIGKLTFSCRHCLKRYPTDLALQGHVKSSHTSSPKYMCQWCGRSFPKKYLPEHFRIHQQIPHKCEICDKIYTTLKYLKNHVRRCHKHWASPCKNLAPSDTSRSTY